MSTNVFEYDTNKLSSTLEFYLQSQNQLHPRYIRNGELNLLDSDNRHLSYGSPEDAASCQLSSNESSPCLDLQNRAGGNGLVSSDQLILNSDPVFCLYNEAYPSKQQNGLDSSVYGLSCYNSGVNNDPLYYPNTPFMFERYPSFTVPTSDKNDQEEFLDSQQVCLGGMSSVYDSINRSSAKKRPSSSNRKERRRTHSINAAFSALRNCIPNVPSDTKLSKIKTLRLATSYIAFLMNVLDKNDPKLAEAGFKADMSSRRNENRDERRRREAQVGETKHHNFSCKEEILKASVHMSDKPSKGRTGWPQQVWASELK